MKKRREKGFTLVELMVVIVVIGLMATVVSVKVIPLIFKSKKTIAMNQMKEMQKALDLYYLEMSKYPEALDELTQETPEQPDGYMQRIPKDPWNEEYVYEPGRGRGRYEIRCKGEDLLDGTEDDIMLNPEEER